MFAYLVSNECPDLMFAAAGSQQLIGIYAGGVASLVRWHGEGSQFGNYRYYKIDRSMYSLYPHMQFFYHRCDPVPMQQGHCWVSGFSS